jgi:hypothetical protein
MDISKFLSKVIGLYEVIIGLVMLKNMNLFASNIQAMINDEPLMIYIGCVTLIMGLLMVVSHNIWQWSWQVMVTIVAWIVLIKGAAILLFPHSMDQITMQFVMNPGLAYTSAIFEMIIGLIFCYFGFRRF